MMHNKAGLVTGAGCGIGRASALALAQHGARVMVADIDHDAGRQTVQLIEEIGGEAAFFPCDVSAEDEVERLVDATVSAFGTLDFAFNNVGTVGEFAPLTDIKTDTWDQVMQVNLSSTFYCLKHEIKAMLETGGGAIVNSASSAGLLGIANNAPYTASQFGIIGMTKSAAMDYGAQGIRINALAPGSTTTPRMLNAFEQQTPDSQQSILGAIPMRTLAEPEDQAEAVVWLCSEQARMITGIALPVDGGWLAGK